jgi:hypothetical protein
MRRLLIASPAYVSELPAVIGQRPLFLPDIRSSSPDWILN